MLKQLVCKQEPCTCRPVLLQPENGIRSTCDPLSNPNCCVDGLEPLLCKQETAAWTCSKVQCEGASAVNCVADGCNNCGLNVLDVSGQVDLASFSFVAIVSYFDSFG